jgi:hypothetical protein
MSSLAIEFMQEIELLRCPSNFFADPKKADGVHCKGFASK